MAEGYLRLSLAFLVLCLIAVIVGFSGLGGERVEWVGQVLFAVFLVLFVLCLIVGGSNLPPHSKVRRRIQ